MAEPVFDIVFSGKLRESAAEAQVKQRVGQLFKLDAAGVERLFSGQRVFVKRRVDGVTAERFRDLFLKAGALVELVALEPESEDVFAFDDSDDDPGSASAAAIGDRATPQAASATNATSTPAPPSSAKRAGVEEAAPSSLAPNSAGLSLAPAGATLEELSDLGPEQNPDISQLSLVDGQDWSLEDCAPPPLPQQIADIDSLALEPLSDQDDDDSRPD